MRHFPFYYILPQFLQRPRSSVFIIGFRDDFPGSSALITGLAQWYKIPLIIPAAEDLWNYVVDGAILSDGGLPAVGADVVAFRPDLFSPVFVGGH